jgi:hypothetical protein
MKVAPIAFLSLLLAAMPASAQPFDRSKWIADFEQLKNAITRLSPNLEWAVERGVDLPALEQRARDRLDAAQDDATARIALERFVRAFADGHMELVWPRPAPSSVSDATIMRSTCADLGYWSEPDDLAIGTRLPGFAAIGPEAGEVRAGIVSVGGQRVGVLRIPLFAPSDTLCAAALKDIGLVPDAPCDEGCADKVARRSDDIFLSDIADRLRDLDRAGAEVLLLDVAGNGGGNDSAVAVARMLGGDDLPSPEVAFVKSPRRAARLAEIGQVIRAGPPSPTAADRAVIARLVPALAQASEIAARPCDLSPLWQGREAGCSNLVRGPFFAGGLTATDSPGVTRTGAWAETLSSTVRFSFTPYRWQKPVMVLVDQNSASSTELLAAMLQDVGKALVIGAPSQGSGCGWTMPREDVILPHSGATPLMPDCARIRKDGRNELDGVEPDVLVGFRTEDTPRQRAARLLARLPAALGVVRSDARRSFALQGDRGDTFWQSQQGYNHQ